MVTDEVMISLCIPRIRKCTEKRIWDRQSRQTPWVGGGVVEHLVGGEEEEGRSRDGEGEGEGEACEVSRRCGW